MDLSLDDEDEQKYIQDEISTVISKLKDKYKHNYFDIVAELLDFKQDVINKLDTNDIRDLNILAMYYRETNNINMAIDLYKIGIEKKDRYSYINFADLLISISLKATLLSGIVAAVDLIISPKSEK